MKLAQLYHGRFALADLTTRTAIPVALPPDILTKGIGGGAFAAALLAYYPDALCLCAGPLTGSYAPASGLATLSFIRHAGAGPVHAAIPLGHGAWLRQSGFDALVITGHWLTPRIIRCGKGSCFVEDVPEADLVLSRARLRAALLRRTENGRAALILGGASHAGLPAAAGAEYGSLPAGALIGSVMRERNILALSLEGGSPLPTLPLPLDNALRRAASTSVSSPLAAFFQEVKRDVPGLALKSAACFHCPSPCLAWMKTGCDAYLLMADHGAFAAAFDACGQNAPACLAACDEAGVDPAAAAPLLKDAPVADYAAVLGTATWKGGDTQPPAEQLTEAERAGLILGMCPRLIRRTPDLSRSAFNMILDEEATVALARSEIQVGEVFL